MRQLNKKTKNIVFAAGGTGGHLFPAQTLATNLLEKIRDCDIVFAASGLSSNRFFKKNSFVCREIASSTISLRNPIKTFYQLFRGIVQAWLFMRKFRPDAVIGFGSYHAFPVCLAACLQNIPLVLFESNVIPGKVNRFLSRFANFSAVQFSSSKKHLKGKTFEVCMPIAQVKGTVNEALSYFSLEPNRYTLLVFGGSQGSCFINDLVIQALSLFPKQENIQVIHITGDEKSAEFFRRQYLDLNILSCVKSFENCMHLAWTLADVAICRSGAGTFAELVLFEVPAILIPYPYAAEQHQHKNALLLQEAGAAFCLEESVATQKRLKILLEQCMQPGQREIMKKAFLEFKKESMCGLEDLLVRELSL